MTPINKKETKKENQIVEVHIYIHIEGGNPIVTTPPTTIPYPYQVPYYPQPQPPYVTFSDNKSPKGNA